MIAIIPVRSGSKGLPGKNFRKLQGIPLFVHTIIAAIDSKSFSKIFVTTDWEEISKISIEYGVEVIKRPLYLAGDDTTMASVLNHTYRYLNRKKIFPNDYFCLLQPTSPLRRASHIVECINQFKQGNYKSALSVCKDTYSPFKSLCLKKGYLEPLFSESMLSMNRQSLEITYRQNGAIYITRWADFLENNHIIQFPAMPYLMSEQESIDIDSLQDFQMVEKILIEN